MAAIDAQTLLSQWKAEYKVPGDILWGGYVELGGNVSDGYRMGQCNYARYLRPGTAEWVPRSTIYLDEGMEDAPRFFQESTLWHEFAHSNAYNEDMESDDHNAHFREYRRRKTKYWIGDMVLKLIGWIWCK